MYVSLYKGETLLTHVARPDWLPSIGHTIFYEDVRYVVVRVEHTWKWSEFSSAVKSIETGVYVEEA